MCVYFEREVVSRDMYVVGIDCVPCSVNVYAFVSVFTSVHVIAFSYLRRALVLHQ